MQRRVVMRCVPEVCLYDKACAYTWNAAPHSSTTRALQRRAKRQRVDRRVDALTSRARRDQRHGTSRREVTSAHRGRHECCPAGVGELNGSVVDA
eukprot:IDg1063t1